MYRVTESATIATVTDLRRRTAALMERADDGELILVQRHDKPQGVYLSYRRWEAILDRLNRLESLELAQVAVERKEAIDRRETGTTSLGEMIAEFAPELAGLEDDQGR